jgi:hypothetical protein
MGHALDYWPEFTAWNAEGVGVALNGFTFDNSAVQTELSMLRNVTEEFNARLDVGVANPEEIIPEFREKLIANGLEAFTAELSRQLEEFFGSR